MCYEATPVRWVAFLVSQACISAIGWKSRTSFAVGSVSQLFTLPKKGIAAFKLNECDNNWLEIVYSGNKLSSKDPENILKKCMRSIVQLITFDPE